MTPTLLVAFLVMRVSRRSRQGQQAEDHYEGEDRRGTARDESHPTFALDGYSLAVLSSTLLPCLPRDPGSRQLLTNRAPNQQVALGREFAITHGETSPGADRVGA